MLSAMNFRYVLERGYLTCNVVYIPIFFESLKCPFSCSICNVWYELETPAGGSQAKTIKITNIEAAKTTAHFIAALVGQNSTLKSSSGSLKKSGFFFHTRGGGPFVFNNFYCKITRYFPHFREGGKKVWGKSTLFLKAFYRQMK